MEKSYLAEKQMAARKTHLASTKPTYFYLRSRTKQHIGHTFDISLQNISNLLSVLKIDLCCNVDIIYNYYQVDC